MKFLKFYENDGFAGSLGCQALQPLLFPKEYQGFVKGCGWLKTQEIMIFIEIDEVSGIFMRFHDNFVNFVDFNEDHDFGVFSHPQPFTKP